MFGSCVGRGGATRVSDPHAGGSRACPGTEAPGLPGSGSSCLPGLHSFLSGCESRGGKVFPVRTHEPTVFPGRRDELRSTLTLSLPEATPGTAASSGPAWVPSPSSDPSRGWVGLLTTPLHH